MFHNTALLLVFLMLPQLGYNQNKYNYFDGPYISIEDDSLEILWIEKGELFQEIASVDKPFSFKKDGLPEVYLSTLEIPNSKFQKFKNISKYVALSDIHGQHQLFIDLLIAQKVIDQNQKWVYGDGHLVIVGDIMDRGDQVTESLWFLYQLERQAELKGGKVDVLLGNHELMVMHGDIGYVHPKYRYTSGISGQPYPDLFGEASILGKWLRSKNIAAVINNVGFVHGGFSMDVLRQESSLKKINQLFRKKIVPQGKDAVQKDNLTSLLYFENGPLWYRGYANPAGFDRSTADSVMSFLELQKIVVGHTSMPNIVSTAQGRIILVDSSIKFGKTGEVLVYENENFYRGLLDGTKEIIHDIKGSEDITSPFQYIYSGNDLDWTVTIDTDLGKIMGSLREKEEYVPATVRAENTSGKVSDWDVRIRTRGNMRKKVCRLPPLKIDFSQELLATLGYSKNDKLKLVLPCTRSNKDEQALYREFHIYKMYEVVDSMFIRTRLTQMILHDKGKEKYTINGFFIEDEEEYESRTGARIIEKGIVTEHVLNRESFLKMIFFQYMILNTDFGIMNKHNVEILGMKNSKVPHVIPYDFDYSGMVNQSYAVPYDGFPIKHVREPYFRGKDIVENEVAEMRDFYNSIRLPIKSVITKSPFLDDRSKKIMLKDIERYYDILNNERKWKRAFNLK